MFLDKTYLSLITSVYILPCSVTDELMDAQTGLVTSEVIHQVPKSQNLHIKLDKPKKPRYSMITDYVS